MDYMNFRLPEANEIEVRIGTARENGVSLLLYQDARVGMTILDETVGPNNWQRKHEVINGNLFCSVGINIYYKNPEHEPYYIWKQDVGIESNTEKEKGQASDAFKRAVVNWGICRCLYSSPFIWVAQDKCNLKSSGRKDARGNAIMACYDKFVVEKIKYDEITKNIIALSIVNATTKKRVFVWQADTAGSE